MNTPSLVRYRDHTRYLYVEHFAYGLTLRLYPCGGIRYSALFFRERGQFGCD
ncbi:MAG: hypothetical protein M1493_05530 [Firmicutes bacterium]|jgi:hypothetical protein|nr:hypothetical protein [Bacillota bacterium]